MADEKKWWWIVEFAFRDLELPHPFLISLLQCLPFSGKIRPPQHIQRLILLRYLLSTSASHRLPSPRTLVTLERLLPPPNFPPSSSLCAAYSSTLFYLSTAPGFSQEVTAVLARLSNYCFSMKLLEPWRALITKQEKIKSCPVNRVVCARDKAIFALRDFVDEEFRAMEPPFIMRSVQELSGENQKVSSMEPSRNSDKGAAQKETEAIQIEKSPTKTVTKQVDVTYTPSRRSDRVATQKKTQVNARETLLTKTGAKRVDGDCTPSKKSEKVVNQKATQANRTKTSPAEIGVNRADYTRASCSTRTSTDGIASAKQNHIYEENQPSPTKSCGINRQTRQGNGTGRNANGASTSHANSTNIQMNDHVSRGPVHNLMDRNPTAHVFEWNDSIDHAPEMEKSWTSIPRKRARQFEGQKGHIPKRRQVCNWQPHEEEALRKAVKEFGKGNWKEILDAYPDEFSGRTAVDLKDKWRNMTRY